MPDALPRALWLDELDGISLSDYAQEGPAKLEFVRPGIIKTYVLEGSTATVVWHCRGLAGQRLTTRLSLAMPSCDGFLGRYVLADGSIPGGFGQPLEVTDATRLTLEDGVLGGNLELQTSFSAQISGRP